MVEIKHQFTEEVLHTVHADTLRGANLAGAMLAVANLAGQDLRGANLAGANLAVANLADANLRCCNLRNADLTGTVLARAKLTGTDLRGANLTGADLIHAILDAADLGLANATGANMTGADLSHSRLQGANLANATMNYAQLQGAAYDDQTEFPALLFDPAERGAVRVGLPDGPEFADGVSWDVGEDVLECFAQWAADGKLSVFVRTDGGWLTVSHPTEALAFQLQRALATDSGQVRAYRVASDVGLLIRGLGRTD
jgi:hypothetical protein